jgi:flagellar protein FliS
MLMYGRATSRYNELDITTSDPMKIVLMLYDGAITFIHRAIQYTREGDIKNKNIYANKARDVIEELNNALDTKVAEELAAQLRRLYLFMNRHLMTANWRNDVKAMGEVADLLENLREAWKKAYEESQRTECVPPRPGSLRLKA